MKTFHDQNEISGELFNWVKEGRERNNWRRPWAWFLLQVLTGWLAEPQNSKRALSFSLGSEEAEWWRPHQACFPYPHNVSFLSALGSSHSYESLHHFLHFRGAKMIIWHIIFNLKHWFSRGGENFTLPIPARVSQGTDKFSEMLKSRAQVSCKQSHGDQFPSPALFTSQAGYALSSAPQKICQHLLFSPGTIPALSLPSWVVTTKNVFWKTEFPFPHWEPHVETIRTVLDVQIGSFSIEKELRRERGWQQCSSELWCQRCTAWA